MSWWRRVRVDVAVVGAYGTQAKPVRHAAGIPQGHFAFREMKDEARGKSKTKQRQRRNAKLKLTEVVGLFKIHLDRCNDGLRGAA
jgi:hypothetical protein